MTNLDNIRRKIAVEELLPNQDKEKRKRKKIDRKQSHVRIPPDIKEKMDLMAKRRGVSLSDIAVYCIYKQLNYNLTDLVYYRYKKDFIRDFYALTGCKRETETLYYPPRQGQGGAKHHTKVKAMWEHCEETRHKFNDFLEFVWLENRMPKRMYKKLKLTQAQLLYGVRDD